MSKSLNCVLFCVLIEVCDREGRFDDQEEEELWFNLVGGGCVCGVVCARTRVGRKEGIERVMASSSNRGLQIGSAWFQRKINLRPQHRGVHLVTEEILRQMPELSQFSVGLCHVQILHTSASLALNESWDPDVRDDMEMMLNKIVPEGLPYRHSCEGPDDMPAHVKACFLGSSLTIPITDGKLSLGTWQGVWLCEHRDHAGSRKLVITLSGCPRDSARSPLSPVSPIASTSS